MYSMYMHIRMYACLLVYMTDKTTQCLESSIKWDTGRMYDTPCHIHHIITSENECTHTVQDVTVTCKKTSTKNITIYYMYAYGYMQQITKKI